MRDDPGGPLKILRCKPMVFLGRKHQISPKSAKVWCKGQSTMPITNLKLHFAYLISLKSYGLKTPFLDFKGVLQGAISQI